MFIFEDKMYTIQSKLLFEHLAKESNVTGLDDKTESMA